MRQAEPQSNIEYSESVPVEAAGRKWNVVDLCCGLGGISAAASELHCAISLGVDISAEALVTFHSNFPTAATIKGSVTSQKVRQQCVDHIKKTAYGKGTIVVSGPPCQGFSVAGPRIRRDGRNRVLSAVARAIVNIQPVAALVENVAALLSARHSASAHRFQRILTDAGYHVIPIHLNAADFGVPQRRSRVIFFVTRKVVRKEDLELLLISMRKPAPTVRQALDGLGSPPVYDPLNATRSSPPNHIAMRHSERVKQKIALIEPGKGPMSYRRLKPDAPSRTLISGNRAPPTHFSEPRSITVREAARLQGFSDDFEISGVFSKQMLHVTNAVPPPLAKAALGALLAILGET